MVPNTLSELENIRNKIPGEEAKKHAFGANTRKKTDENQKRSKKRSNINTYEEKVPIKSHRREQNLSQHVLLKENWSKNVV